MDRRTRRLATTASLAALLTGCISTVPFDARQKITPARSRAILREYTSQGELALERALIGDEKRYIVTRITIPEAPGSPETIVDYYRTKADGNRPLLFMSPPLGTSTPGGELRVERPFITFFANNNWDVALVYRPRMEKPKMEGPDAVNPIDALENGMRLSVAGYRRAIDVLSQEPRVRSDRLCALGISMGGIITTVVAGIDSRIRYTVIALAGSTDKVLANADEESPEGFLRKLVEVMRAYGGKEKFIADMAARSPTQPQRYADKLDPLRTMLIISRRDKVIPRDAAEDLRERAHYPTTRYIHLLGHTASFVLYPVLRREAMEFYEKRIGEDDALERLVGAGARPASAGRHE